MTTLELVKGARARIADRNHWTQGEYARKANSRPCGSTSPDAVRWCAMGALEAEGGGGKWEVWRAADAISAIIGQRLVFLNDNGTHEDVLAAFDRAISNLEKQR